MGYSQRGHKELDTTERLTHTYIILGFPDGSVVKNPPANSGDAGLIPVQEDPLEKDMATDFSILA